MRKVDGVFVDDEGRKVAAPDMGLQGQQGKQEESGPQLDPGVAPTNEPGEIADPAAYAAAKERGEIRELPKRKRKR